MEVPLRKLTDEEIDALTNLLSRRPNYGIAIPSPKWLSRQQEKVDRLPEILLEPKNRLLRSVKRLSFNARKVLGELELSHRRLPEKAVLCSSHDRLNPFLMRECFWLLCLETGENLECLRRWPHKSTAMASWLTRLDSVTAYFTSKAHFHQIRFVRVASECEACILAAVGANGRCLADLFTALVLRQDDYCAVDARKKYKPRLMRFVDSWIRQMGGEERQTIRRWIEELLAEIQPGHLEIRTFWREYQEAERRKRRERRKREGGGGKEADGRSTRSKRHSRHVTVTPRIKVDHAAASEQRRLYRAPTVAQSVYREDSIANQVDMAAFKPAPSKASGGRHPCRGDIEDEDDPNRYPVVGNSYDDSYEHEDEIANDLEREPEDRSADYSAHRSHRRVSEWYSQCLRETGGGEVDPEDLHPALRQENSSQPKSQAKSYFSVKSAVPPPLRKGKAAEEQEEEYTPSEWTDFTVHTELPQGIPAANAPPVPRVPSRLGQKASSSVYVDEVRPGSSTAVPSTPGSPTLTNMSSLDPDGYRPVSPLSSEGCSTPTRGTFKNPWTQSEHHFVSRVDEPKAAPPRQPDKADDGPKQAAPRSPLFDRRELSYPDSEVTHHDPNKRYLAQTRGGLKAVDPDKNPFIRQGSTRRRVGGGGSYQETLQRRLDQDEQSKLHWDLSVSRRADPDLLAEDSASCVAPPSERGGQERCHDLVADDEERAHVRRVAGRSGWALVFY
ncbi:hypothetical protein PG997_003567 [Apiospora hydei]|uniref:Uncharacterized protein n=1 Tax=Apiospora hydei TaxID=1337664 RepID=A0ABR1WZP2_9PEZI